MLNSHQLRARAVAEWRGLPEIPFATDCGKPILEPLAKVMASLGLADRLREEQVLLAWREIVGEFIAGHSCPQKMKDGVLYVRVLHPSVHFELDRVWKKEILEKLKKRFGGRTVRDIRFRVG